MIFDRIQTGWLMSLSTNGNAVVPPCADPLEKI